MKMHTRHSHLYVLEVSWQTVCMGITRSIFSNKCTKFFHYSTLISVLNRFNKYCKCGNVRLGIIFGFFMWTDQENPPCSNILLLPTGGWENDIALVRLEQSVPSGAEFSRIQRIKLPTSNTTSFPAVGDTCVMKGWGCTAGGTQLSHFPFHLYIQLPNIAEVETSITKHIFYKFWNQKSLNNSQIDNVTCDKLNLNHHYIVEITPRKARKQTNFLTLYFHLSTPLDAMRITIIWDFKENHRLKFDFYHLKISTLFINIDLCKTLIPSFPNMLRVGLTFDLLTWISIGIIFSSRTIYLPSLKLLGQSVLELSVAQS